MRPILSILCISASIGLLAFAGCNRVSKAEKEAALETIRQNAKFLQEEKIPEMMTTIHPQSPSYGQTAEIQELLRKFDLKCTLGELNVISATPDEMRVAFEQTTEKVRGEDPLPKTKITGIHIMKKDGTQWKIWKTEVRQSQVLEREDQEKEP